MTTTREKDPIINNNWLAETSPVRCKLDGENAVRLYAELCIDTRDDGYEHAKRTASSLSAFAGDKIPEEAIQLALVHDVFDRFWHKESSKYTPQRAKVAQMILLDMMTEQRFTEKQINYCLCQLHDMVKTEQASGQHRVSMAGETHMGGGMSGHVVAILSEKYNGTIDSMLWQATEPYIDFVEIGEFLCDTNIEAVLTKAVELLDNMRKPSSGRESALLQDILEAESFYAPILEVLGVDGLASALRGEAHTIRLMKQGRGHLVDAARNELTRIRNIGIDKITGEVFGGWSAGECRNAVGYDEEAGEVPVIVGDSTVWPSSGAAAVKYRIKTAGSLANKLDRYGGAMPADLVGYTVISSDKRVSAANFADFIVECMPGLEGVCAKSKEKPFYVYGSSEYVNIVRQALVNRGVNPDICQLDPRAERDIEDKGYRKLEVAKATLRTSDGVPVEVQFITKAERAESRTGEVAHIIYKYLDQCSGTMTRDRARQVVAEAKRILRDMWERRTYLSPNNLDVNERSLAGGQSVAVALAAWHDNIE